MSRSYAIDTNAAAQAGVSNYISETGKYVGKLKVAEIISSEKGTEGVEFSFETDSGQQANFLQLWTYNADGKQLSGFKVLNAMLACLKLRGVAPKPITVNDNKGSRQSEGFPDMCGKSIGLLLQREEYEKRDGSMGYKFNIQAPFDATTELTAGEILNRETTPFQLEKMVSALKDKPFKKREAHNSNGYQSNDMGAGGAYDPTDIPFANPYRGKFSYVV